MSAPLLEVDAISKRFRGLQAVDRVSFSVPRGAIIGLIGPNGAGKTTIFNMIAGVFAPDSGSIRLDGNDITRLRPDQTCRAGIGRTFQLVKPFAALSVLENVVIGAFRQSENLAKAERLAMQTLERLGLADKASEVASSLTLPERKRLETARALATAPKLLLLDEVMAGLRPTEIDAMVRFFSELCRDTGLTILLTEHVMRAVMALSHHIVVVHHGQKICEGSPQEVAHDPKVLECYLGSTQAGA
ncbi:amino acid/amide ABC transporter ATP-binding protein 1, HAAT family [Rhizobiales bacterium GAS188]|nr:amino acid/amide ABC transporter ATP-binding protein 1, HAAT family [Rhizobiales bacterium GAS188]